MDPSSLKIGLTGASIAFELGGLYVIVKDAQDAARRAADIMPRETRMYVQSGYARGKGIGTLTVTGDEPTIEQRVSDLEERLSRELAAVDDRIDRVDRNAQVAASQASGEARAHADALDRNLRVFLADAIAGGRVRIGAALFVVGLLFAGRGEPRGVTFPSPKHTRSAKPWRAARTSPRGISPLQDHSPSRSSLGFPRHPLG